MKHLTAIACLLLSAVLTSCVRDEVLPCPPLQVEVTVKDKNYFNVDRVELEAKLPDDLPLRRYVPTIHYRLSRLLADGTVETVVNRESFAVETDELTHRVTFDDRLPHGTYVMNVWGGLTAGVDTTEGNSLLLHPDGTEGSDIFLSNDTLVYSYDSFSYVSELERTKGKLLIEWCNLPEGIALTDQQVTGLYETVSAHGFTYNGVTEVHTTHRCPAKERFVTPTLLSPSVGKDRSLLSVRFADDANDKLPVRQPRDVTVTLHRNELTVLRYVYDDEGNLTIYMLVNDNWEEVHGMELD